MQTVTTTLTTKAVFSDDHIKRYLLRKAWDEGKPALAIIMLAPSNASGIELDSTTLASPACPPASVSQGVLVERDIFEIEVMICNTNL